MKRQKGITLIALVISIIVMLILAGVSINAVVGDNGILTKAMQTGYLQSIAVLEEFLQMEYSTYAAEANEYNTALELLKAKQSNWFYKSAQGYVLDSDGHVLYLINKAGVPEDIQKQLRGGDCDKISQYYKQEDVYGVTSDLKVYYCNDGTDTILGLTTEDLDKDNPLEIVYDTESLLAKLVNGTDENGNALKSLSAQDLKKITELTIDDIEKYELLSTFSSLPNLSKVVFKDVELDNITGISGATKLQEVRFENSTIANYTDLRKCTNLNKLYLLLPPKGNDEVITLCSTNTGIGNADFANLEYFAINGFPPAIGSLDKSIFIETYGYNSATRYNISNVDAISQLSEKTKQSIKYLYLNNLQITSLENALTGFSNVSVFRVSYNSLNTLKGIENLTSLEYLFADNQLTTTFGVNDGDVTNSEVDALASINGLTNLKHIDFSENSKFKWCTYLKNLNNLEYLNLDKCTSILDFHEIADLVNSLGLNAIYSGSLAQDLISDTSEYLNLASNTIYEADFRKLTGSKNLIALNLNSTIILKEDGSEFTEEEMTQLFYDVLSDCTNMKHLAIASQSKLTNIDFVKNMTKLNDLNLNKCTGISDVTLLEELTVANKLNLNCLILSNELIDLTSIQTVISNLGKNHYDEDGIFRVKLNDNDESIANFWYSANAITNSDTVVGLVLQKMDLVSQLEQCTEITNLVMYQGWRGYFTNFFNQTLDLSACTALKNVIMYNQGMNMKLPVSLEKFNYMYPCAKANIDFTECVNLQYIYTFCLNSENVYNDLFSTLPSDLSTVKCITIRDQNTVKSNTTTSEEEIIFCNDLNYLSHFANCKNLTKFSLQQNNTFTSYTFKNLDGLQYLTSLKELELRFLTDWSCDAIFPDLSGLTNLEYLKITDGTMDLTNVSTCNSLKKLIINNTSIENVNFLSNITTLEEIDLSSNTLKDIAGLANSRNASLLNLNNNNLTDVYPLINLNSLNTLYLQNNKLTDFSYDASGKNYYTLTVFMDLNDVGSLKNLYINGNLIDNFTMLTESGLKWNELVIE